MSQSELRLFKSVFLSLSFFLLLALPQPGAEVRVDESIRIGRVKELKGTATAKLSNGEIRDVLKDGSVFLNEELTTGPDTHIHLEFLDKTLLDMGPNAKCVLDQYVYDPANRNVSFQARMVRGVFRLVTGEIAKISPEKTKVNLPTGSLGIRGTTVLGDVTGMRTLVILSLSQGELPAGHHIVVSQTVAGKVHEVNLDEVGYGTMIEGQNMPPGKPFRVSTDVLNRILKDMGFGSSDLNKKPEPKKEPPKEENKNEDPQIYSAKFF